MSAEDLLSRLEGVRQTGPGSWMARCPAHHDKHPSLAINVIGDGTILLHDFAGCNALAVVEAVGLGLADLFPKRLKPRNPQERKEARAAFRRNAWCAALRVLAREAAVVCIAAEQLRSGRALEDDDRERLEAAYQRIDGARAVLANGR